MQSAELDAMLGSLDRERIETTIRTVHALHSQAKYDALERYFACDVVFEYVGDKRRFPYAGRYEGAAAIISLLKTVNTEIETLKSTLLELLFDGNRAFSRRRLHVRHRGTGIQLTHEIWDIWRFRDGLIQDSQKLIDIRAYAHMQGE
ncbi:MAG: nuclear transport factor 2 family protein [Beijerinckiaceae bacterium]